MFSLCGIFNNELGDILIGKDLEGIARGVLLVIYRYFVDVLNNTTRNLTINSDCFPKQH
jgi:hypothetical protein